MSDKGNKKPNKTLRAFGKKLGAAKIAVMERTGKLETTEPQHIIEGRQHAEETREYQKDVYKKLMKATKSSAACSEDQLAAAAAFREYGNQLAVGNNHAQLAGMFLRLSDFQEFVEELRTRLDFLVGLRMSESMKDFIKGELREARYDHKRYGGTRRTYDATETQCKQVEKNSKSTPAEKEAAKEDVRKAKETYEAAEYKVGNQFADIEKQIDYDTLENCCDYLEAYNDFFTKGQHWLAEIMPRVTKYREQIFEQRKAHDREKEQRHGDLDARGVRQPRCFGAALPAILQREQTILSQPMYVPHIVSESVKYICRPEVLKLDGLFRVSGQKNSIDKIVSQYEDGDLLKVNFPSQNDDDAHCITGLIKMWLRRLPEPLCTFEAYSKFTAAASAENHEDRFPVLKGVIAGLPVANQATLKEILRMCSEVVKNEADNRMTASNVAIVIAPNILYPHPSQEDPMTMRTDLESAQSVVESLIIEYEALFAGGVVRKRKATMTIPSDRDSIEDLAERARAEQLSAQRKFDSLGPADLGLPNSEPGSVRNSEDVGSVRNSEDVGSVRNSEDVGSVRNSEDVTFQGPSRPAGGTDPEIKMMLEQVGLEPPPANVQAAADGPASAPPAQASSESPPASAQTAEQASPQPKAPLQRADSGWARARPRTSQARQFAEGLPGE